MNMNRRSFLGTTLAAASAVAMPGCCSRCCGKKGKVAVQLYSIREYIRGVTDRKTQKTLVPGVGLAKALEDVARIGYKGVEFAGYYGFKSSEIKKMLDDNGLVACGTHIARTVYDNMQAECEFNLGFGNNLIICPGSGNRLPDDWKKPADDWWKFLADYYNRKAEEAAKFGCKIGLHNHDWEFRQKLSDGTTVWDYFFSNTADNVCMEQDVGWTTCAGYDPCEQFKKYPRRSPTLHAKENGCDTRIADKRVWAPKFDAILGKPGVLADGTVVKGVDWDRLFPVTDADGVEWYVVECERHAGSLLAIEESFKFLKSKGRC